MPQMEHCKTRTCIANCKSAGPGWNFNERVPQGVEAGDSLTLPFCSGALTPLGGSQAHFKLPVPGWIAAPPHTGRPEDLGAIAQLTVCINLLHVGHRHAPIPGSNTEWSNQYLQVTLRLPLALFQSSFPSVSSSVALCSWECVPATMLPAGANHCQTCCTA